MAKPTVQRGNRKKESPPNKVAGLVPKKPPVPKALSTKKKSDKDAVAKPPKAKGASAGASATKIAGPTMGTDTAGAAEPPVPESMPTEAAAAEAAAAAPPAPAAAAEAVASEAPAAADDDGSPMADAGAKLEDKDDGLGA